jgi:hypothetical protein
MEDQALSKRLSEVGASNCWTCSNSVTCVVSANWLTCAEAPIGVPCDPSRNYRLLRRMRLAANRWRRHRDRRSDRPIFYIAPTDRKGARIFNRDQSGQLQISFCGRGEDRRKISLHLYDCSEEESASAIKGQVWIDAETGGEVMLTGHVRNASSIGGRAEVVRDIKVLDGFAYARFTHLIVISQLGQCELTIQEHLSSPENDAR